MRILLALTYYRPHLSGVTVYAQRLAEALAAGSHQVTVLTSRYDAALKSEEWLNGVRIVRVPVAFRVSKGAIMPGYWRAARSMLRDHDVVLFNLPNTPVESLILPLLARWYKRPLASVYHCDVRLPKGLHNRLIDQIVFLSNAFAGALSRRVIAYTQDYADNSRLLRYYSGKTEVIPPPVSIPPVTDLDARSFRDRHAPREEKLIGFAARFATEKGVKHLLRALPIIRRSIPNVKILFAGEYVDVIGERRYWESLRHELQHEENCWEFLGVLPHREMAQFYQACDVTVLPSINSTESFGLVQVESMLCGTPVVASDLPGVRVPVQSTGMGRLASPGDEQALAEAIIEVLGNRSQYVRPRADIESLYSVQNTARRFEDLLDDLAGKKDLESSLTPPPAIEVSRNGLVRPAQCDFLSEHLKDVPAFRALLRGVECRLFQQAGPLEQPVLDLGCGDGHFASMAFEQPLAAGVDASSELFDEARKRKAHAVLIKADAARLPFPDEAFKTVISNSVLEHVKDLDRTLEEAARVLQPGGRFIFSVPGPRFGDMLLGSALCRGIGLERLSHGYGRWFNGHSQHYHLYDPGKWKQHLESCGFQIERWQYYLTPAGLRAFDLGHYLGLPRLISRKLTGKWVPIPNPVGNALYERWLRKHYVAYTPDGEGPYIFFETRKRS